MKRDLAHTGMAACAKSLGNSLIFYALLVCAVHAGEVPSDFSWRALVRTKASSPYYRITLPVDVYLNAAQPDLADVRIFNATGMPVPYARTMPVGSSERSLQRTAVRWFPLRRAGSNDAGGSSLNVTVKQADDGALVEVHSKSGSRASHTKEAVQGYLLDASAFNRRENIEALELDWNGAADGFQLLDIEASDNLQDWRSVLRNVHVARLNFNGERIERRRIELDGLPGRYLKLLWRDPAIAPALTRVEITHNIAQGKSPPLAWSAQVEPLRSQLRLQPGEFHYRLARALPVSCIRIALPQGNVLLPLEILQLVHGRRDVLGITHGVVYRINGNGREWIQDEINLSGQPLKEFIIRFDPRSSRGVSAPALLIGIEPEQVVFLAEGAPPYLIAVGNGKVGNGALPLTTLVPGLGSANAPQIVEASVAVDTATASTASKPASSSTVPIGWKTMALWGLLIAGVLAMGAMAWQLVRQMKEK